MRKRRKFQDDHPVMALLLYLACEGLIYALAAAIVCGIIFAILALPEWIAANAPWAVWIGAAAMVVWFWAWLIREYKDAVERERRRYSGRRRRISGYKHYPGGME